MQSNTTKPVSASGLKICILVSSYHNEITDALAKGAMQAFEAAGGSPTDCQCIQVAGAWELPVVAKAIGLQDEVDAIVTLGCIITGETTHDRVIADGIANGLMQVALQWGHPVALGVLTCQTMEQAEQRAGGTCGNKGTEAMQAAISTSQTLREYI